MQSFRGLYALLYRNYSGLAHPTYRGLNDVVEDLGVDHRRVQLEPPYDGSGPYSIATVIFALALYITANTVSWPPTSDIEAIFQRHR